MLSVFAIVIYLFIALGALLFMEVVAWFTHKYIMHGVLWRWHKDHHIPHHKKLEKNDRFVVLFALPAVAFLVVGYFTNHPLWWAIGGGITGYGLLYFLFHDVYVHQRIKLPIKSSRLLEATKKAHQEHHQPHANKNFGFIVAPLKYYREAFKKKY